jgi:hypothetical protein
VTDSEGRPCIFFSGIDVTTRRQEQELLRASRADRAGGRCGALPDRTRSPRRRSTASGQRLTRPPLCAEGTEGRPRLVGGATTQNDRR